MSKKNDNNMNFSLFPNTVVIKYFYDYSH